MREVAATVRTAESLGLRFLSRRCRRLQGFGTLEAVVLSLHAP